MRFTLAIIYLLTVPAAPLWSEIPKINLDISRPTRELPSTTNSREQPLFNSDQSLTNFSDTPLIPAQDIDPQESVVETPLIQDELPANQVQLREDPLISIKGSQFHNNPENVEDRPLASELLPKIAEKLQAALHHKSASTEHDKTAADFVDSKENVQEELDGWKEISDLPYFRGMDRFPAFYKAFIRHLDQKFVTEYQSDRNLFLRDVEQNRFVSKEAGLGELETKHIAGQAAIRFVPENHKNSPITIVWVNVPLSVNTGLPGLGRAPPLDVLAPPSQSRLDHPIDPPLGNQHLQRYVSRLLIDRTVKLMRIFTHGSWGETPHRAVYVMDQSNPSASVFFPALKGLKLRTVRHWAKAKLEKTRFGDKERGGVSAFIQLAYAYSIVSLGQWLLLGAFFSWPSIIASGLFALIIATNSDTYNNIVTGGNNETWESIKRLLIGAAFINYPITFFQAHYDWHALFTAQTTLLIILIGFGDRYLSTVMNVVPKIHQKYFMKPWFFPVRVNSPFREQTAKLWGRMGFGGAEAIENDTIKGVTLTREVLAISRFLVKLPSLVIDPLLMKWEPAWTASLFPPVTLLLWGLGIPFRIVNYYSIKKLAANNPRIQEDLAKVEKGLVVKCWLFSARFAKRHFTSRVGNTRD